MIDLVQGDALIRKGTIIRATAAEMKATAALQKKADAVQRLPVLSQAGADRIAWDEEDEPIPEGWEKIVPNDLVRQKQAVNIRLDVDLLEWFRAQGPGYQTRINAVLRAFMQSRPQAERPKPKSRRAA